MNNKKTLKYGSASIILAAVFIALVIAVNLIVTAVTNKFNLFADLTKEQLYEISEASEELLKDIDEQEVRFIFFTPLDELDNDERAKSVKTLALEYEEKYDYIKVEYLDMLKNPGAVAKYRRDYSLSSTTVVVESAKRFVAFDMAECFVYSQNQQGSYDIYAFNGEYRFTSALIRVTKEEMPRALFTSNHLEAIPAQFKNLLVDAGFEVELFDLSQNDIPKDTELIIINDPKADFTGIESETEGKSEITKLSSYLENGGNAMIFVSPQTPVLKNLDELCAAWGIEIIHELAVTDSYHYISSIDPYAVIAQYAANTVPEGEEDILASFHSTLSSQENPLKTVSYYTSPLKLIPLTEVTKRTGVILESYNTATVPLTDKQNYIEDTKIPLLVASQKGIFDAERGENVKNFLVVGGSTFFTSDTFLGNYGNTYGNLELIKSMVSGMTDETMMLNVSYKEYNDTALTIDNATSQKWLTALVMILPALVLFTALAVFLKRRHL